MDITKLKSSDLKTIGGLLKKKEKLVSQIQAIDARLASYGDGSSITLKPRKGPSKPRGRRGLLKDKIITALVEAGKNGLHISEIAEKVGNKVTNLRTWFYTTGKTLKPIKSAGRGRYKWDAKGKSSPEEPKPSKAKSGKKAPKKSKDSGKNPF